MLALALAMGTPKYRKKVLFGQMIACGSGEARPRAAGEKISGPESDHHAFGTMTLALGIGDEGIDTFKLGGKIHVGSD
jgi:hypothetical protein